MPNNQEPTFLLIRREELDQFDQLMKPVPYEFAKPIEMWWTMVQNNRAIEYQQAQQKAIAEKEALDKQIEEDKIKEQRDKELNEGGAKVLGIVPPTPPAPVATPPATPTTPVNDGTGPAPAANEG